MQPPPQQSPPGYPQQPGYPPQGPPPGYPVPQPPPPQKSTAKTVLIVVGVLVGLVVIGSIVGEREANRPVQQSAGAPPATPAATPSTPSSPAQAEPPAPTPPRLGETFQNGSYAYTLDNVSVSTSAGSGFARITAEAGSAFVLIDYSETNNGNETGTVAGPPMFLRDSQGRRFEHSSRVETALMMSGGNADILSELQPGIRHVGHAGFEVPANVVETPPGVVALQIVFLERGLTGTREVAIPFSVRPAQPAQRGR